MAEATTAAQPSPPQPSTAIGFWTIGELAARCGNYCWLEGRLFELTGSWACAPATGDPEIGVFFSEMSARHAFLAGQWYDRLPVRAGVDPDVLVVPPPGRATEALDLLRDESDLFVILGGLVEQFLPRLLHAYDGHLARASPVGEAPVRSVLELARLRGDQEVERGRILVRRAGGAAGDDGRMARLASRLESLLGGAGGLFPTARAS